MSTLQVYDYPPAGSRLDPFDVTVDEPQYLILANHAVSHAWLDRDARFGVPLTDVVVNGRFTLLWTQKVAVAIDGVITRSWPLVVQPRAPQRPEPGEQTLFRDPQQEFARRRDLLRAWCGYRVVNSVGQEPGLSDSYDADVALDAARVASADGLRALALFSYDGEPWY